MIKKDYNISTWYAFLVGFLPVFYNMDSLREVSSLLKNIEFFLIPLVEVHTSKPIRDFFSSK
jgi:hypothetical protein